jgi:hypothetical protein
VKRRDLIPSRRRVPLYDKVPIMVDLDQAFTKLPAHWGAAFAQIVMIG